MQITYYYEKPMEKEHVIKIYLIVGGLLQCIQEQEIKTVEVHGRLGALFLQTESKHK